MTDNSVHPEMFSLVFPCEQTQIYEHLASLVAYANDRRYEFLDMDVFNEIIRVDPARGQEIYWRELVDRAHFAATVSSVRHFRWINGCLDAANSGNYLVFCASFRGLLESTSDSFDALYRLPMYFAQNRSLITRIFAREDFGKNIMVAPEVEQSLIHFSHARKKVALTKESPAEHRAKRVTEYLQILERGRLPNVMDCYGELCEVAHPAALSLSGYIDVERDKSLTVWRVMSHSDARAIRDFRQRYAPLIEQLMMFALNPVVLLLYVLDTYPLDRYRCPPVSNLCLDGIPEFLKIVKAFDSQRTA